MSVALECPDCKIGHLVDADRCDNCGLSMEDIEAAAELYDSQWVYCFRIGSRDFPTSLSRPWGTRDAATEAAYAERQMGYKTGRVRRVTRGECDEASRKISQGILPAGF